MRWLVMLGLAALALLILFFPLSAATSYLAPGLEADSVSGSIWNGRLRNAHYAGLPLGDVDVGLDPARLLKGEASLRFQRLGPRLQGRAGGSRQLRQLEELSGELPLQVLPAPAPALTIRFEDVHVAMTPRGACRSAGGHVSTSLTGIPFLGETPPLSGAPACDGDRLFAPLRLAGDRAGMDLWLAADGSWEGRLRLRPDNRLVLAGLSAAGFTIESGDATLTAKGRLQQGDVQLSPEVETIADPA
ncbi:type II secretion system protein N [Sandaracinobacter neustonicus]|nr:type II secretion system protein N [Sandaracinobacter neustonicus]